MQSEFKFEPLETFQWYRELKDEEGNVVEKTMVGEYHPGMTYNCTRKPVHDALREKCVAWEKEGKIKILALPAGQKFQTVKVA